MNIPIRLHKTEKLLIFFVGRIRRATSRFQWKKENKKKKKPGKYVGP